MIEYIEVRGNDTNIIGIVDTASSVIWHSVYFGVGDFEIQAKATPEILALLQAGRYVTRPDNDEVGVIEKIYIPENTDEGATITASGRFVKSLLERRVIYNLSGNSNTATILRGNVENAIRTVISNNAIACPFDGKRNIALLGLGDVANIDLNIIDSNGNASEKQVTYENLLTYTDAVLEEYNLSSKCILKNGKFLYVIYSGTDLSVENENAIPVIFSEEFDNLTSSEYTYDETPLKNVALVGGEGEGNKRFYSVLQETESDLQRREIFIDANSIKKTVKEIELNEMFPDGIFADTNFYVGGKKYAALVVDNDNEYSYDDLTKKFPNGYANGTKFVVEGVTYANKVYGDDEKYKLTPIGYRKTLILEEKEGEYMLTDAVYDTLLKTKGKQDIAPLVVTETFNGVIDATNGNYVYGRNFSLGDIVTVQNNRIGKYVNVQIREALEYQDGNGYSVEVKYQ